MSFVQDILTEIDWKTVTEVIIRILLILAIAWTVMKILNRFLRRFEEQLTKSDEEGGEAPLESVKRVETLVRLVRQAALLALWLTAGLMVLKEMGVQIAPVIASAGVLGLAVGIGAQNLVRDVIAGFFIILENQIRVGDVAIINGTGGLVERIKFRTTVLRDLGGVIHVFPNGTITTLSNLTNEWSAYVFEIGVAYKEDPDRVIGIMKAVGKDLKEDAKFGRHIIEDPEIFGVDKFGDSAVIIKGRIKTRPIQQWAVGREFLRRIKYSFEENGIEIPFPHRSIYFGEASKPFELMIHDKYPVDHGRDHSPSAHGDQ